RFEYPAKANRPRPSSDYLLQVVDGLAEKRKLIERLRDRDAELFRLAGLSLKPSGPEARAAVPTLLKALEKDDADVRAGAAAALRWIVPLDKTAVPSMSSGNRYERELLTDALNPAQNGQPVALLFLARLCGVACHSWSGELGQRHQTLLCDPATTIAGVRSPFFVGCHSAASWG